MYIFPGVGLGVTVCKAKMITNKMLHRAALALASFVKEEDGRGRLGKGSLTKVEGIHFRVGFESDSGEELDKPGKKILFGTRKKGENALRFTLGALA